MESILIVDDHALIAHGIMLALRARGLDVHVCVEPALAEALTRLHQPAVALVDLQPEADTSLVTTLSRMTPVIVLTDVTDRTLLGGYVEAGAAGMISKRESFDLLLDCIRSVLQGQPTLSLRRGAGREDR